MICMIQKHPQLTISHRHHNNTKHTVFIYSSEKLFKYAILEFQLRLGQDRDLECQASWANLPDRGELLQKEK